MGFLCAIIALLLYPSFKTILLKKKQQQPPKQKRLSSHANAEPPLTLAPKMSFREIGKCL